MEKIVLIIAAMMMSAGLYAQETEKPEVYKMGKYEVYVLTEGGGSGDAGILIDAPAAVLAEYAPGGTFPIATNAVLVRRGDEVWLIDTGYGMRIFENMAALGIQPEDVDHILLTHMHGDHIGGMFRGGEKTFPNADVTVSQKEFDYWSSDEQMNKFPENRRGNFISARKVFAEYRDRLKTISPYDIEDDLPKGVSAIAAYGHTPGHTMFMLKDGGKQLLIWGDLTHAMAVQMPHPEISVTYDVHPDMARESRLKTLKHMADKEISVIGMHVDSKAPGRIYFDKESDGYRFGPLLLAK